MTKIHGVAQLPSSAKLLYNLPVHLLPSLLPSPIHDTAAVFLSLLQQHLVLPLGDVACVDIATRLDAETTAGLACWRARNLWNTDVLASVELERGLCTRHLKVDLGLGVVGAHKLRQRQGASVEGDCARRLVDDEAIIDIRLLRAQRERLVALHLAKRLGAAGRNASVVDGEVAVRGEGNDRAFDRWAAGEVEVPVSEVSRLASSSPPKGKGPTSDSSY